MLLQLVEVSLNVIHVLCPTSTTIKYIYCIIIVELFTSMYLSSKAVLPSVSYIKCSMCQLRYIKKDIHYIHEIIIIKIIQI